MSEQSMAPLEFYSPLTTDSTYTYTTKKGRKIHCVMQNQAPQNTTKILGQYSNTAFSYILLDDY